MMFLDWDDSMAYSRDVYYWGIVFLFVVFPLTFVIKPPRNKKSKEEKPIEKTN